MNCGDEYKKVCGVIDEAYDKDTAGLTVLSTRLKGEVMFGTEYADILKAFAEIDDYK
jgi:hypothetical protein